MHRTFRASLIVAAVLGAMVTGVTPAPQASAAASQQLRVVTANLQAHGPIAVAEDWNVIGPNADIVFVQEAKNVVLRDILGPGWIVRQDTTDDSTQGSAVVIRRSAVSDVGSLQLVKGTDNDPCGIMTRWIAKVPVQLLNGRWIRVASLHMPPGYCQTGPGGPYDTMADNVVDFVKLTSQLTVLGGDWNKIVDDDPNNIGARTGLLPRGPDSGDGRIDGFYVSKEISTCCLHYLSQTTSDHLPVEMTITVPAP